MTLAIAKPTGAKLVLAKTFSFDPDAIAYITAVEAADGQTLETATRYAINNFVIGCKQDGIWSAIKASCILAGARTLIGALVPLVGAAPTNNNFVSADFNRKTGLIGNGTTKYLNSNRAANADPTSNMHLSVYLASIGIAARRYVGAFSGYLTADDFLESAGDLRNRSRDTASNVTLAAGLYGTSRTSSTSFVVRSDNAFTSGLTDAAVNPGTRSHFIFAQNDNGSPAFLSNARLPFYSIGEALDLALLDARVTTLINAIAAAIP